VYYYRRVRGLAEINGARIPFCVECWAEAESIEKGEDASSLLYPLINRSAALSYLWCSSDSVGLNISGCGLSFKVSGPKRAEYDITLSVITPYVRLMNDGKTPYMGDFRNAIEKAVKGAAGEAYRNLIRPPASMSIKDAAYSVMEEAYLKASGNGTLPANARQIMYAARGKILELTGLKKFKDSYFTQLLLPDYMTEYDDETEDWDVVYDSRGALTEPHTGLRVALGTIAVREYLGQRAPLGPPVRIDADALYPTSGPESRYRNVLFVEKEGFDELWRSARLAERYDLAIMSTKGMSVVASRKLIDGISEHVDNIFVLRDFDVSGFSIFGTLGTDSRRYTFDAAVDPIDVGLRLDDVLDEELQPTAVR
jgi:hypothetical protein